MLNTRILLTLLSSVCVGCSHLPHRPAHKPTEPAAPAASLPRRIGTVAMVNQELHFVLVDTGSLSHPQPGEALKTFRGGEETGALKVSQEYRRPYVAADIVSGAPEKGDEVLE